MDSSRPRAMTPGAAVDGAAVFILLAVGLAGFWPVFGGSGFIRPALVGLIAGAAVAWLSAWRRWPTWLVAVGVIVAYFLFGTTAALWQRGMLGFVPNLSCLRSLVFGSVEVWRQFVTASTPVGSFFGFTLVPFIVALVGSVAAFCAAWRAKHAWLALIPVVLVSVCVILLGTARPFFPTVQAIVVLLGSAVWLAWRHNRDHEDPINSLTKKKSSAALVKVRNAGIVLAAASVVAGATGPMIASGLERDVIRSHVVPPLDMRDFSSPLVSFRDIVESQKENVLFTIEGWDQSYRLRMAVMDAYDGMVYNVGDASGMSRYDRVGPNLEKPSEPENGVNADIHVSVGGYSGVWVPSVSDLRSVEFSGERADELGQELYYNPISDAAVNPTGLHSGDEYTISSIVPTVNPTATSALSDVDLPEQMWVPDAVADLAAQWAGDDPSPLTRVTNLVNQLKANGFFSHGLESEEPSKPGHSSARIAEMLSTPKRMIGDDEQYSVVAALMLRSIGVPARVVMGFYTAADSQMTGSTWKVTGSDVHAWVEVPFDGVGWYAFYPTPDENQQPQQETQQSKAKPKPQVLQPPPPVSDHENDDTQGTRPDDKNAEGDTSEPFPWGLVLTIGASVAIPLAAVLIPVLIIIGMKARRHRKRIAAPDPVRKIAGGWQEVLDQAADMGVVIPQAATRKQAGRLLEAKYEVAGVSALAAEADIGTFGPQVPPEAIVTEYWNKVDTTIDGMTHRLSLWKRLRAKLSLASLKGHPHPTITMEEIE